MKYRYRSKRISVVHCFGKVAVVFTKLMTCAGGAQQTTTTDIITDFEIIASIVPIIITIIIANRNAITRATQDNIRGENKDEMRQDENGNEKQGKKHGGNSFSSVSTYLCLSTSQGDGN